MLNRRGFLMASAAAPLAMPFVAAHGTAARAAEGGPTFVLVHGAWHGGWCWDRVTPLLTEAGAKVTTPTLTGLGERNHLISRSVNLETHVEDIIAHIKFEELTNVVLVGHSYAGFPATLAAARLPEVVSHLVLLDAYFPKEGETVLDHLGPDFANDLNAKAAADVNWDMPPLPAEAFGLTGDDAAWVNKLLTTHPIATQTQAATFGSSSLPSKRSYIRCTESTIAAIFQKARDNVQEDGGFGMADIAAGHDVMVDQPKLLAETLLGLSA